MGQNVDVGQVAQQIGTAIAQAVAAAPAAAAAAAAAAQVPFALTPALATTGLLDYSQKSGSDIFKNATASLPTTFKSDTPNLLVLTNELETHASTFGWASILTVTPTAGNPSLKVHRHYNAMTLAQVKTHVDAYIDLNGRSEQNDYQLYVCINATIDEASKKMMSSLRKEYTCGAADDKLSGVLYLKVLLAKSAPQAKAMATHARSNIMNLHVYMRETAKDDITLLHEHVKTCIAQLTSVNQSSTDIEAALFKAYAVCKDEKFRQYTERLQDDYNEDMTDSMNYDSIMDKTDNVFKIRTTAKTCFKPSDEQLEIHSLRGQVQALSNSNRRNQQSPSTPSTPPARNTNGNGGGGRSATEKRKAKFDRLKPEWRKVKPKQGESHSKTVNGVEWHYCIHHGYWVQHTSTECRDKPAETGSTIEADIRASLADVGVGQLEDDSDEE